MKTVLSHQSVSSKEDDMAKTEPRRLRLDLTHEQKAEALRIGDLTFKSHRLPDMRIEQYPGIGPEGRAA
jgi:hypothetical protein